MYNLAKKIFLFYSLVVIMSYERWFDNKHVFLREASKRAPREITHTKFT